jgi:hypothetical protein
MHADSAACGDKKVAIVQGIGKLRQAEIGSRRGSIDLGGRFHVERFMGSFLLECAQELVEFGLLLEAFDLPGKLVGVADRSPRGVRQGLHSPGVGGRLAARSAALLMIGPHIAGIGLSHSATYISL